MAGLIILSSSITSALFMYGSFDIFDARMTALSLVAYSLGLPAFIFMKILVTAFFSRQDTKTPVLYSLVGISINILANVSVLFVYLNHPFEGAHAFIALATSLSAWVQVILMSLKLRQQNIMKNKVFINKADVIELDRIIKPAIEGIAIKNASLIDFSIVDEYSSILFF